VTSNGMVLDPFRMQRVRVLEDAPFGTSQPGSGTKMIAIDPETERAYSYLPNGTPNTPTLPAGIYSYSMTTGKRVGALAGRFPGSEMDLLPTGELLLSGREGITLIPTVLVK
jgi:hypothetical protein